MTRDRACPYMGPHISYKQQCRLSLWASQKHMRGRASPTETNPVTLLHPRACWGCLRAASYSAKDHLKPAVFVTRGYSLLKTATQDYKRETEGTMLNKCLCQTSKAFLIADKLLPPNIGLKNTRYKRTLTTQWNITVTASNVPWGDVSPLTNSLTYTYKHDAPFPVLKFHD